ncbi:MAG TPA: AAA family ATPase [Myxococcota bacterium]|nr:AAA family ATPase [Myxococcota bacterium]
MLPLHEIDVANFRSLQEVRVVLGPLNVLVGPNAAGKSNLLEALAFLGDLARTDVAPALERHGGLSSLLFRGGDAAPASFSRGLRGRMTTHASERAPDAYRLDISRHGAWFHRQETFTYKRTRGPGRRITTSGGEWGITTIDGADAIRKHPISADSAALATLPRLGSEEGAEQLRAVADLLTTLEVFDPDVAAARRPSPASRGERLRTDASNLASYLHDLSLGHPHTFALLVDDLRAIVPGLQGVEFEPVGGPTGAVKVQLVEVGLRGPTDLAHASFGTVRALALLAMLHDPRPPKLRCVEEIDHGLHPYALDRLVERLRDASGRGQLILATHSPALVNRLRPEALIICERDPATGASRIPAISRAEVDALVHGEALGLGELWFSGALGGNP